MFPGMALPPPYMINPLAAAAAAFAAGQPQLPPMQQLPAMVLPIAPLHTGAAGGPAEGETDSHGSHAASLLGPAAPAPLAAAEAAAAQAEAAQPAPEGAAAAGTPGALQGRGSVALTAHLSEVLGAIDPDIRGEFVPSVWPEGLVSLGCSEGFGLAHTTTHSVAAATRSCSQVMTLSPLPLSPLLRCRHRNLPGAPRGRQSPAGRQSGRGGGHAHRPAPPGLRLGFRRLWWRPAVRRLHLGQRGRQRQHDLYRRG